MVFSGLFVDLFPEAWGQERKGRGRGWEGLFAGPPKGTLACELFSALSAAY